MATASLGNITICAFHKQFPFSAKNESPKSKMSLLIVVKSANRSIFLSVLYRVADSKMPNRFPFFFFRIKSCKNHKKSPMQPASPRHEVKVPQSWVTALGLALLQSPDRKHGLLLTNTSSKSSRTILGSSCLKYGLSGPFLFYTWQKKHFPKNSTKRDIKSP